jgi:TPR repeat protein
MSDQVENKNIGKNFPTTEGLIAYFENDDERAAGVFLKLVSEDSDDPVPYHILTMMMDEGIVPCDPVQLIGLRGRVRELTAASASQYTELMPLIAKYVERDNPRAQLFLSHIYTHGYGVERNSKRAAAECLKAATHGNKSALYNLGLMYLYGRGVDRDDIRAAAEWTKAVELGHSSALYNLGLMYFEGRGVAQSDEKAVELWIAAADQDNTSAQNNLGFMYYQGRGIAQSDEKAAEFWSAASRVGNVNELSNLVGFNYENSRRTSRDAEGQQKQQKTAR